MKPSPNRGDLIILKDAEEHALRVQGYCESLNIDIRDLTIQDIIVRIKAERYQILAEENDPTPIDDDTESGE